MNDKDRIRLAEWMGWIKLDPRLLEQRHGGEPRWETDCWVDKAGVMFRTKEGLPNPFTDANDDYAVLGWMRANGGENVIQGYKINYRIGDYARAALKVIEDDFA